MTPEQPFIPPRQPGESAYAYRYRRTLSLYGQTPYQRRIFLAQQRGIGLTAARGHAARGGQSEYQRRRQRTLEQTGVLPSVLTQAYARNWLISHGFTPETTGASWTYLYQMEPSLRTLDSRVSPQAMIDADDVAMAVDLEQSGEFEPGWTVARLRGRVFDTIQYQDFRDKEPGRYDWNTVRLFAPSDELDIKWWYYHLWHGNGETMGATGETRDSEPWTVKVEIYPTRTHSLGIVTSISCSAPMNLNSAMAIHSAMVNALISWLPSRETGSGPDSSSTTT